MTKDVDGESNPWIGFKVTLCATVEDILLQEYLTYGGYYIKHPTPSKKYDYIMPLKETMRYQHYGVWNKGWERMHFYRNQKDILRI